nr:unnamed protein product [Spirometra erinaceieuropaei]
MQPPFLISERQRQSRASTVAESGDLSSNSQDASSYFLRQRMTVSGHYRNQHDPPSKATTAHEFRCPTSTRHLHESSFLSRRQDDVAGRGESDLLTSEFSTDCTPQQQQQHFQRHHQQQLQKEHQHHHASHAQQQKRSTAKRRRHLARGGTGSSSTLRSQSRRERQRIDQMGVSSAQVTVQRSRRATPRRGSQTRFANPDTQVTRGSAGDTAVVVSSSNHSYDTSTLLGYFDRTDEPNFSSFQRTDAQLDSTADKRQDHFSTLTTFQLRCIHAMADIIMCPYTVLPVSIGLFTRPGVTSREAYMHRLFTYLKELQKQEEPSLEERAGAFDLTSAFLPPAVALLLSYILSLLFGWQLGLTVGLTSVFLYLLIPITLNLGASYTAWDAAVQLSEKMWAAGATKYSMLAMHLQWAGKDIPS